MTWSERVDPQSLFNGSELMASNDKLKLGVGNSAQDPTVVMASKDDIDGDSNFELGRAILEAGPGDEIYNPQQPFIGLLGRGQKGRLDLGYPASPGVVGYGGDLQDDDNAGSGLVGIGGDGSHPGAGLFGLSGASESFETGEGAFGAGVVGVSGGLTRAMGPPTLFHTPPHEATSNVGVYGESSLGPGVRGISQTSDGVQGQADKAAGVRGESSEAAGVSATSGSGDGIQAFSKLGRGGVFAAGDQHHTRPQLRLVPQSGWLPIQGKLGDLMVLMETDANDQPTAGLWLCIREPVGALSALWGKIQIAGSLYGTVA
jgi:hypothetical protein